LVLGLPAPGLEPGPAMDKVLSLACLPIPSHRLEFRRYDIKLTLYFFEYLIILVEAHKVAIF
jgi:hypothetical protein